MNIGLAHENKKGLFVRIPDYPNAAKAYEKAAERYAQNRFSVTRQLRYSQVETQRALDLCLFINGLPIATFELKNSLTKQTVDDALSDAFCSGIILILP